MKAAEIRLAASTVVRPKSAWISVNTRAIRTKSKPSSKYPSQAAEKARHCARLRWRYHGMFSVVAIILLSRDGSDPRLVCHTRCRYHRTRYRPCCDPDRAHSASIREYPRSHNAAGKPLTSSQPRFLLLQLLRQRFQLRQELLSNRSERFAT